MESLHRRLDDFYVDIALIVTLKTKQWVSSVKKTDKDASFISNVMPFFIAAYDGGFGLGSSTFGIL
jgi:uncharacterized protein